MFTENPFLFIPTSACPSTCLTVSRFSESYNVSRPDTSPLTQPTDPPIRLGTYKLSLSVLLSHPLTNDCPHPRPGFVDPNNTTHHPPWPLIMTLVRQAGEKMERSDSGFGDSLLVAQSSTRTRHSIIGSSIEDTATERQAGEHQRASTPGSTRSRTPQKPRPSISHRTISRQSSVSANSPRSRTTSSRSSFIIRDATPQNTVASQLQSSRRTKSYCRPETANPYVFHRKCQSLFDPPKINTANPEDQTTNTSREEITKSQTPNTSLPPTTIDWTLPTTRRREYEKIEASSRGIRGLWRRFAPKRCRRNSRLAFYDGDPQKLEDDSDAGSVRRYRVSLDNDETETSTKGDKDVPDSNVPQRSIRGWRCFGRKDDEKVDCCS